MADAPIPITPGKSRPGMCCTSGGRGLSMGKALCRCPVVGVWPWLIYARGVARG